MALNGLDCLLGLMVVLSPFFLGVLIAGIHEELQERKSR